MGHAGAPTRHNIGGIRLKHGWGPWGLLHQLLTSTGGCYEAGCPPRGDQPCRFLRNAPRSTRAQRIEGLPKEEEGAEPEPRTTKERSHHGRDIPVQTRAAGAGARWTAATMAEARAVTGSTGSPRRPRRGGGHGRTYQKTKQFEQEVSLFAKRRARRKTRAQSGAEIRTIGCRKRRQTKIRSSTAREKTSCDKRPKLWPTLATGRLRLLR